MENISSGYIDSAYEIVPTMDNSTQNLYDYGGNFTFEKIPIPLVKQPPHLIAVYSIAYGLVFIFGLIGNSFVIAVIFKDPSMRNVTNYFILNLAVADIFVAMLCVPITLMANLFTECLTIAVVIFVLYIIQEEGVGKHGLFLVGNSDLNMN